VIFTPASAFSQYILNGNATQESCNCYLLTQPQMWQGGSVWQSTKISLNDPFDFAFNVYLGCQDASGADGIVFMLQPLSTSLGTQGGGLGFGGVSPSIGISLDTWQNIEASENNNDPAYDHISIQANGVTVHGNDLAGPIPASASSDNIEDCAWHVLRIKWDPATHILSTYFDGVFRLSTQTDLVATVFKNDPMVYWGFSASTGGSYNIQKFCTALNPVYNSGLAHDQICYGTPVTFTDSSTSFTTIKSYFWDFGDGTTSTLADPPPHVFAQPGIYQVKHSITAMDNCGSDPYIKTIRIGDRPTVSFAAADTCESLPPRLDLQAGLDVGTIDQWAWEVDGVSFSELQKPDFTGLAPGTHSVKLTATSDIGCVSDPYSADFVVRPAPRITMTAKDGCEDVPVSFSAIQGDVLTTVHTWDWDFGDGTLSDREHADHVYARSGTYPVQLEVSATNGCTSKVDQDIFINRVQAHAGNDTLVIPNTNFQLNGGGGAFYSWSPATGLSNPDISDPVGKVSDDVTYHLTVKTIEGCTDTASLKVTVFKGSAIYVPTAFTPNHDGLNDILKPYYIGIRSLSFFTIFNRWGQKVFSTSDLNAGWDGNFKSGPVRDGSYVWVLKAVDIAGKTYELKGNFMLLH
jgi:gliding motility-associated-like protein